MLLLLLLLLLVVVVVVLLLRCIFGKTEGVTASWRADPNVGVLSESVSVIALV